MQLDSFMIALFRLSHRRTSAFLSWIVALCEPAWGWTWSIDYRHAWLKRTTQATLLAPLIIICCFFWRVAAATHFFEHVLIDQMVILHVERVLICQATRMLLLALIVVERFMYVPSVDHLGHHFLWGARFSSLLLGEHASQVKDRLASEAYGVCIINHLTFIIIRSNRLFWLAFLDQILLLSDLFRSWGELSV